MGAFDQRPRFFEGQYLSATDLSAVVDYLRGAQARQALGAHTWGIGVGLNLVERPAPGAANRREVILQPGWARDGFGRQLVVQQPTRLAEGLFAALPYNAMVDGGAAPVGRLVKVWLAYAETGGRTPAPGFEVCDLDDGASRIEEGFEFVIGELATAEQRNRVVIGAHAVDALDALKVFDPTAAPLHDTSVPHQTFPAGDKPPRWRVPVGQVRWVAGNGVAGYFVDRGLVAAANVDASIRALRRYGGCVVQDIEASDGAIVLRARGDDPAAPHRFAQLLGTGQSLATLRQDLVWVEGGLRCEGDAKLAGSRLLLRNLDGLDEGNALYLARAGDGSGLPGRRELRAVIGGDARTDNRFVVGPEPAATPGGQVAQLVVVSSGRVGVNTFDPACALHVRGGVIRLEDGAGAKRIDLRNDGAGVELRSDTHRLYLRSTGPAAQNNNRVIINPTPATDGRVGIGVDDPQTGLDVHQDSVGFSLDRGNGGRLVLRSAADAASRDKVFLEASVPAGGTPAPELRATGPAGVNLPLFSAYADTTYLRGRLGVGEAAPAADTQLHVRGTRIRLQSVDGSRSVDLRADGSAVDLQSNTNDLYLRSTNAGGGTPRNILMNPYPGDGNVGIGLATPAEKLHVQGRFMRVEGAASEQVCLGSDGSLSLDSLLPTREVQLGSFNAAVRLVHLKNQGDGSTMDLLCDDVLSPSDATLKDGVAPLRDSLGRLGRLRGVHYRLRDDPGQRERIGFIAQEVAQALPEAVAQTARGLAVSYTRLVPVLVEALKELQQQVQALQARVDALDGAPRPPRHPSSPASRARAAANARPDPGAPAMDLEIHRLSLVLRLAGDPQRLEPESRRLRDVAAARVEDALARIDLAGPGEPDGDELIFIERLDVQCGASTAWDDAVIAGHIARRFALALQARMATPGLLRFRDRTEFVAAALVGFAEERAGRCWWLAEFEGLQALSRSAALRTLIVDESDVGIAALARLTDGALAGVLGTLGESDGVRLLTWIGLRGDAAPAPLAALWPAAAALPPAGAATAWLRALVAAERVRPGSTGNATLRCLRALVALHALARDGALARGRLDAEPRAALHHALVAHRLATEWLEAAAEHDVAALAADLARRIPATGEPDRTVPAAWLDSPHGGLFILLSRAQRLGWIGRWQALMRAAWPSVTARTPGGEPDVADVADDPDRGADALCRALTLRVATLALAGPGAARVRADGAVRSVCGTDGSDELVGHHSGLAVAALRAVLRVRPALAPAAREGPSRALARLLAEAASRLLDDCARACSGLLGSSPDFLRAQALALPVRLQCGADGADSLACLGRAPLDVLLVLAGVKRIRIALPGVPAIRCMEDVGA